MFLDNLLSGKTKSEPKVKKKEDDYIKYLDCSEKLVEKPKIITL